MRVLISATSRSGKRFQGRGVEGDGCIYVCGYNPTSKVLQRVKAVYLPKPLFIGNKHRLGARGLAMLPSGNIVCANHDSVFLMEPEGFTIINGMSLVSTGDVHDLVLDKANKRIAVTCASSDSIQFLDYNLNHIGGWKACEVKDLHPYMVKKHKRKMNVPIKFDNRQNFPLYDFRMSFNGDVFHLNTAFMWNGCLYTIFSTMAKLYNITENKMMDMDFNIVNPYYKGGRLHSGVIHGDILTILNTHHGIVEQYNMKTQKRIRGLKCKDSASSSSGLSSVLQNGFLRGMLALGPNEFLVGQIGPRVYHVDFSTNKVKELANFEGSDRWSVYAMATL